jgi:uncharacterized DUF497 family protein
VTAFDFDPAKNAENLRKHGVSLALGAEVLADIHLIEEEDRTVSYGEVRFIAFGMVHRVVYGVIYTDRVDHVRIISVRRATPRETDRYFQARG